MTVMRHIMHKWLRLTLKHGEEKDEHLFLQTQQFSEQLDLAGIFVELSLEYGKDMEESRHCIPETTTRESLLVQNTRTLKHRLKSRERYQIRVQPWMLQY